MRAGGGDHDAAREGCNGVALQAVAERGDAVPVHARLERAPCGGAKAGDGDDVLRAAAAAALLAAGDERRQAEASWAGTADVPLVWVSAETGEGRDALWSVLLR